MLIEEAVVRRIVRNPRPAAVALPLQVLNWPNLAFYPCRTVDLHHAVEVERIQHIPIPEAQLEPQLDLRT
eukprot:CAMPEP_0113701506 /NCGR_PEP_ID=MMETSP0038_2-20120614/24620_1 /TAXON_ID=2898 /ORGANISM="Cryptomonas paramecium" /LENGTH=69 /DNA_ID=CAMNT_0000625421 /DNA_START=649 /DNA_END=854 /DNA_ORIENTATION=+ /assembly_acc=CAM_ASM_000170